VGLPVLAGSILIVRTSGFGAGMFHRLIKHHRSRVAMQHLTAPYPCSLNMSTIANDEYNGDVTDDVT